MDELCEKKLETLKDTSIVLIRCINHSRVVQNDDFCNTKRWEHRLFIHLNNMDTNESILEKFSATIGSTIDHIFELGMRVALFLKTIGSNTLIVINNAQHLSNSAQVSLQEGIDHINFQRMFHVEQWRNSGSLIFVDADRYSDTFINYHKPLYQRFDRTFII